MRAFGLSRDASSRVGLINRELVPTYLFDCTAANQTAISAINSRSDRVEFAAIDRPSEKFYGTGFGARVLFHPWLGISTKVTRAPG
jgi:hypothetical protein